MNLKEFITNYVPLSTEVAVFDNISNDEYFEGKVRELYNSNDAILNRLVDSIEPDYNYAGILIIVVEHV
jgi:hypothetical protein